MNLVLPKTKPDLRALIQVEEKPRKAERYVKDLHLDFRNCAWVGGRENLDRKAKPFNEMH